jgi:hypothetical protein
MTTCSVTEDPSTHNPASITPTPDQDGAGTRKKETSHSNFNGPMTPRPTPFTDIEGQSNEENMKPVKSKICNVEEPEGVELNPSLCRSRIELLDFTPNQALVDISPAKYELNTSIIDYNFTGESTSRCGAPELFGASNPNSRCGTPSNFQGASYNLPDRLGNLEPNVGFSR